MKLPAVDQMGRPVACKHMPQRIVSLVPSLTELLYDLGLGDRVIGITKFCIHPTHWYRSKTRVGGTKSLHLDRIVTLNPDLIIGNKEENERTQIEWLAERFPVWMSDIVSLADALEMIKRIGTLTNTSIEAEDIAQSILLDFAELEEESKAWATSLRTAYLIWRSPWMAAANHTFIHEIMCKGGFENVFAGHSRYPETTLDELAALNPEVVLLSSEPFPFAEKHIAEIGAVCPNSKVFLVDGELFSWYGSRMLKTPPYLRLLRARCQGGESSRLSD